MMKTTTRLAISNDKSNKVRSILIIVSIILTTTLLMTIATYGYAIIKSNRENAPLLYGDYCGSFIGLDDKKIDELDMNASFGKLGRMSYVSNLKSEASSALIYADNNALEMNNVDKKLISGEMPANEKEIAASIEFFKQFGVKDAKIGDKVTLEYRTDEQSKYVDREFKISGILKDDNSIAANKSYVGYVSREFYFKLYAENMRSYNVFFLVNNNVKINSNNGRKVLEDLAKSVEIDKDLLAANDYYIVWALDPGTETIGVCAAIGLCVILFSIAVIYNIFQVGITQKVQEYGKIKALGATKRQLKRIVLKEGFILALIGIPVGIAAGYMLGSITYSWLMDSAMKVGDYYDGYVKTSMFSIWMVLLVVLLTCITIYIALLRPMRIVSKISAVEAMRYSGNTSSKKESRRGYKTVNVWNMTKASLSANKKRMITTICTMGLSCVLFVVIANFVGNIDIDYAARQDMEKGEYEITLDYSLSDTAYPENNLDSLLKANELDKETVQKIKNIDGVTGVTTRKTVTILEDGEDRYIQSVAILDREDFNKYINRSNILGGFDYDKASKENAIIFGWSSFLSTYGYKLGDTVNATINDGKNETKVKMPLIGSFASMNEDWAMTQDTYNNLKLNEDTVTKIWVDCKVKDRIKVKKALDEILKNKARIELRSYEDVYNSFEFSCRAMKYGGYTFLIIVGLIGFMNMTNTLIISIVTRKQEFGVLQAVGMTNRQLNLMLQLEGVLFTIGTVLVSLIIGIPAGYGVFIYGKNNGYVGLNIYHFPLIEVIMMIVVIALLQIILSFVLTRNVKKESLVERIRYQG